MNRIALYHLETLLWIVRLGTFRATAERLNTTQPAISARVRELEAQLGVSLFQRDGRRMVLTARGRRLVRECEPLWVGFEQALLNASDFAGANGTVRIGTGEIAAASCLPGFVQSIEKELQGVTLEIEIDLTARMLQNLLAGTCDIVFLAGPISSPGVKTEFIGAHELVWVASRVTAASGGFSSILPVWSLPRHSPLHDVTFDTLKLNRVTHRSISTCNNVRTLIDIVAGGGGAAVLPEIMVRNQLADRTLVEVLPRPARQIRFEVAVRSREADPLVLELFTRAQKFRLGAK